MGNLVSVDNVADENKDCLVIDIGPLQIPQFPVFEVKKIERVKIIVLDNLLPEVLCRKDFPVVPHLNVHLDGAKSLCLFDVPFREIEYMFNASMFIRRIVYWFEKTARGELHQSDQPLEPFFPYVNDYMIMTYNNGIPFFRYKTIESSNGDIFFETPLKDTTVENLAIRLDISISKVYTENIINKIPETLGDLDSAFNEKIVDKIIEISLLTWNIKQNQKLYKTLFNQSEKILKNCPVFLVVEISLARDKESDPEQWTTKIFKLEGSLLSFLISCGYCVRNGKIVKSTPTEEYRKIKLKPFEALLNFDKKYARRLNNIAIKEDNKFIQIGLGALGSQIANNCIREGYGIWTFIDPDRILPHNLARHCLFAHNIGENKAFAMKSFSEAIIMNDNPPCVEKVYNANAFSSEYTQRFISDISNANLVVDTSASIAVSRFLCHTLSHNTRCVSLFMNPSGTALIMLAESADKTIKLDTLEMQYYSLLTNSNDFNQHLKSEKRVVYSSSCRNTSLTYSQDNVSIFSGIGSKEIKKLENSDEAIIKIWTIDEKDTSIHLKSEKGCMFNNYRHNDWQIKVSSALEERLYQIRTQKIPYETGGVLIGSFDYKQKICYIVDSIDSIEDSEEYPCAFVRGSKGLSKKLKDISEITIDNLSYVGEWHSHPNNNTNQSADDKKLMDSIVDYNRTNSSPGCMIIVGETHISVYLNE